MRSWFRKLLGGDKGAPPVAVQNATTPVDHLAEMERFIGQLVAAGYETPRQILDSVSEYMSNDLDARTITLEAGPMLERALAAHQAAEETWPAITDYDRLRRAFIELDEMGIIARENFSCCGSCGSAEIWDELDNARAEGTEVRGYTFFHMQDTEHATEGDGLYLNYGAVDEGEAAALGVAATVVRELERNGLVVDWDGSWAKRIGIRLDWKRRRDARDTGPWGALH